MPVHQRVVEADAQAFGASRLDVLLHQVAPAGLFRRAIIRVFRIEQAETLVVLGGHHHVLLPGAFGEPRPLPGDVRLRVEALGELHVLGKRNRLLLQHPLAAAQHAVQAPVNEHAELSLMPPLHAAFAVRIAGQRPRLGGGGLGRGIGGGRAGKGHPVASRHRIHHGLLLSRAAARWIVAAGNRVMYQDRAPRRQARSAYIRRREFRAGTRCVH